MLKLRINKPFDLENTITCGQIFRFKKNNDDSYTVILSDRVINVFMDKEYLCVTSNNEEDLENVIINYFDLNNDYDKIIDELVKNDKKISNAAMFSKGLKFIKQEPFETLIEYIISANNGVNNIGNSLNLIAQKYGKKVIFENKEYYLFPNAKDLKDVSLEDFRNCKVGFRDKYLKEVIYKINNNEFNLDLLYELDDNEALKVLMEINGIGPKVASCILLFAYQKYKVFPVDTWVKKIMKSDYNIEGEENIRSYAKKTYGNYSGIAIQYLFNYSRNNKE